MKSFFSINPETIKGADITFKVYINSSSSSHQKFVCLFKPGTTLSPKMVEEAKVRFHQLYLSEDERDSYLDFLSKSSLVSLKDKSQALKDSAVSYLEQLVGADWQNSRPEYLASCVMQCRDVVCYLIDIVDQQSLDQIKLLLKDLAEHDFYTYDHSINVCIYSLKFYKIIFPNHDKDQQIDMGLGALLHDIGKSKISNAIINKPSDLTKDEFKKIQEHPSLGREIFLSIMHHLPTNSSSSWFKILDVIYQHHENVDGSGYPKGLNNSDININARICSIADMFDAITTKRSYADVLDQDRAIDIMSKLLGKKIDALIFQKLLPYLKTPSKELTSAKIDNLILHPFFDPSVPYGHLEMVEMPVHSYEVENSNDYFGRVIVSEGVLKEVKNKKAS